MRDLLRGRLGREIAVVLAIKLLALLALWALFFSEPGQAGADRTASALLGSAGSTFANGSPP